MNNRIFAVLGALAIFEVASQAQITVTYQSPLGTPNVELSGAAGPVPNGNTVEIGYFDTLGGFNINTAPQGTTADLQTDFAHWHLFDSTTIVTLLGNPGRYNKTTPTSFDSSFDNRTASLWIFQTTGNNAPNTSTFANVLEYGLYGSTVPTLGNTFQWVFPAQGTPVGLNAPVWTSSDIKSAGVFYYGSFDSANNAVELQSLAVPEPGGVTLFGFGLVLAAASLRKFRR